MTRSFAERLKHMGSSIRKEYSDFFISVVKDNEPYPVEILRNLAFDDTRYNGDKRFAATIALKSLLDAGYSEDEVNPWKKRNA